MSPSFVHRHPIEVKPSRLFFKCTLPQAEHVRIVTYKECRPRPWKINFGREMRLLSARVLWVPKEAGKRSRDETLAASYYRSFPGKITVYDMNTGNSEDATRYTELMRKASRDLPVVTYRICRSVRPSKIPSGRTVSELLLSCL